MWGLVFIKLVTVLKPGGRHIVVVVVVVVVVEALHLELVLGFVPPTVGGEVGRAVEDLVTLWTLVLNMDYHRAPAITIFYFCANIKLSEYK